MDNTDTKARKLLLYNFVQWLTRPWETRSVFLRTGRTETQLDSWLQHGLQDASRCRLEVIPPSMALLRQLLGVELAPVAAHHHHQQQQQQPPPTPARM